MCHYLESIPRIQSNRVQSPFKDLPNLQAPQKLTADIQAALQVHPTLTEGKLHYHSLLILLFKIRPSWGHMTSTNGLSYVVLGIPSQTQMQFMKAPGHLTVAYSVIPLLIGDSRPTIPVPMFVTAVRSSWTCYQRGLAWHKKNDSSARFFTSR
ncbi:uncharacterized protein MYCFIDRAFT_174705 [Pseudocercospora fijiensis CIRAD86]|uniref:Uncharacterized protein n=1 Tax=Pseudocercospora fijiensis (strain CIRAD86) TaxID=383855 RepID=M3B1E6_PSEFD|nr:uncharacterized protein MYCFIDRAFT_174705 [Pseudocercospora fijiensis CIRAD86]EME83232.1 hypothetical protein MYCFIDRAFT_174705 [Pseudocercospora fijiensis CIRAD86]